MIEIKTIGKKKKSTDGTSTKSYGTGGGFANGNVTVQNNEVQGVNIWGQYHDHKGDVDGDMMVNGNITSTGNITSLSANINTITSNAISANAVTSTESKTTSLTTDFLTVTKQAHFFNLTIDEVKAAGGQIILSAANATVDEVVEMGSQYMLAFRKDDGTKYTVNPFKANDQILCQTFNLTDELGAASNKYYWAVVNSAGDITLTDDGEEFDYNCIYISRVNFDGDGVPEAGDKIVQLGYRGTDDDERQSAIILSAYKSPDPNVKAPAIVQYAGIDTFSLDGKIVNQMSPNGNTFTGNFRVVNGNDTTDIIDLINGQQPQVVTDSSQSWIMADSNGKTYALSDYQNLPTVIQTYLGNEIIPYSEWTSGSTIRYRGQNYRLVGNFTPFQTNGLFLSSMTKNTNDVTIAWDYSGSSGVNVSNSNLTITINFTHNGTSYTAQKTVPFNVIKASEVTQGADAEFDKLMVDKLDFTVTLDNKLTCNIDAKVYHIKGDNITQITDLTDYSASVLLSNGTTITLNKSTSFTKSGTINSNYTGMQNPPTSATLRLYKSNVLVDEANASIKFAAGSVFEITDNAISAAVQQSNGYTDNKVAQVQLTADGISSRVTAIENDYVTSSELTQTADNIQLNVYDNLKNKTGIDVSAGQITLNGNTLVNGNLTISESDQGFTLVGEGGITQIMPKSVCTFDEFQALTTTTIKKENKSNGTFLTSTSSVRQYKFTTDFIIGTVKAGETISVQPQQTDYYITMPQGIVNIVGQGNISEVSKQISFIEGDEVQQTTTYQSGSVNYLCQGDSVTVRTTYTVNIDNLYFENGGENPYQIIKIDVTVPNDVFMLIGNDGIAVNFGTTATAYIGAEGTTIQYSDTTGFRVNSQGVFIKEYNTWYSLADYILNKSPHP